LWKHFFSSILPSAYHFFLKKKRHSPLWTFGLP
jgi:hypothetical protein